MVQSQRLLREATELLAKQRQDTSRWAKLGNIGTNLQLYIATGEKEYLKNFDESLWTELDRSLTLTISTALNAVPHLDASYKEKLKPYIIKYKDYILSLEKENPYGVPIELRNWAGSNAVTSFGTTVCFAHKYYPDIIDASHALKASNFLFGTHPYHNYSLVATVGASRPKEVFYGNNRADFSFIPGNVAPGVLFRKPDHFENYDDWPFLWGQNEGTIAGNTNYLIFGLALKILIKQ